MNIVKEFKVEERMDSDHMPLIMSLESNEEEKEEEDEAEEEPQKEERREKIYWSKEAIEIYKEKTDNIR